jgi:subtilase family serine protease
MRKIPVLIFSLLVLSSVSSVAGSTPARSAPATFDVQHPLIYRPLSLSTSSSPPFLPSDIWKAYDYLPLYSEGVKGNGTRIAIIDPYGDPTLSTDLAGFDLLTNLTAPHLSLYYPDGTPTSTDPTWAVETALDVEWAHSIAPSASIDLVITVDGSFASIYDGISYVARLLPDETVLSMSFGASESSFPGTGSYTIAATHQLFLNITSHGTAIFASSGDIGASSCCNVEYPASDPLVVAVGGTSLFLNSDGSYQSETTWYGSSAGSSTVFSKPYWQQGLGDSMRDIVDVSYDADPNTGVMVVQDGVQLVAGGTSAGTPQWAALAALASQANREKYGAMDSQLYQISSYHDITTGSDGFFSAGPGWDYPTGLGTPDAAGVVSQLAPPIPVSLNNTQTFQGVRVTTRAETLRVVLSDATLSGIIQVTAANSTTGALLFSKNYTITNLKLYSGLNGPVTSFLLRIPVVPYTLSSNVRIFESTGKAGENVTVTRNLDIYDLGVVNIIDLAAVARLFGLASGKPGYDGRVDVNGDGTINILDMADVARSFGAPEFA